MNYKLNSTAIMGEAFYNDKMDEAVQILEEKGLLKESKGASIVELDDVNPSTSYD